MSMPHKLLQTEAVLNDPRWAAIVAREAAADEQFCYSVSTTGIYCRPGCASRLPRPEHVRFHENAAAAEAAGFRACKALPAGAAIRITAPSGTHRRALPPHRAGRTGAEPA